MEKITINGINIWFDPDDCNNCIRDIVTCREVALYLKKVLGKAEKPSIFNERRVIEKYRGTVAWDEAYERRSHPHNYGE